MILNASKKIRSFIVSKFHSSALQILLLGLISKSKFMSSFWFLCSGSMGREHRAVLAGRYRHLVEYKRRNLDGAMYTLRRNTHRLEKGLIMRPRRSSFALDYIGETVKMYQSVTNGTIETNENPELVCWAKDVLTKYFDVVGQAPQIEAAKKIFDSANHPSVSEGRHSAKSPYLRKLDQPLRVTIDSLEELAIRRRSCRWFIDKPVPREIIDRALTVACYAPSACNRQPFEFRFFDDSETVERVAAIPGGTAGFYHNFPCVAVIIGNLSAFPFDRDRHVPYIDGSLAAMGFQFALEVQGLSSCCINWPDVPDKEKAMSKALNLPADQCVVMLLAIGYPDPTGEVPYSQKKSLDELRSFNKVT